MEENRTHLKSKKHKRIEKYLGRKIAGGLDAFCHSYRIEQSLIDDPEQVTCLKCLAKMQKTAETTNG